MDLRSSGLTMGKKSFLNLEVNLFIKEKEIDFKSQQVKDYLKSMVKNVINQNFNKNDFFVFTLTKKDKNQINQ